MICLKIKFVRNLSVLSYHYFFEDFAQCKNDIIIGCYGLGCIYSKKKTGFSMFGEIPMEKRNNW